MPMPMLCQTIVAVSFVTLWHVKFTSTVLTDIVDQNIDLPGQNEHFCRRKQDPILRLDLEASQTFEKKLAHILSHTSRLRGVQVDTV